jgi:hypothetical protein
VYAGVAIVDKRIVAMHAAWKVVLKPAEERSDATVKPKKAKRPTVWPKTADGIVKTIHFQKIWMIILQQALGNGVRSRHGKKIRYIFA